jgi:hypothetical protein
VPVVRHLSFAWRRRPAGLLPVDPARFMQPRDPARVHAVPWTGIEDLESFLYGLMGAVPRDMRNHDAVWVMDDRWWRECEALAAKLEPGALRLPGIPTLLGIPVLVTEEGRWPHLEPRARALEAWKPARL